MKKRGIAACAVAEAVASSQRDDGNQGSHHAHHDGDGESGRF